MDAAPLIAAAVGLLGGTLANRLIVREPAYLILDPRDLPDDADDSLLDELAPVDDVAVPILSVLRPHRSPFWWCPVVELVGAALLAVMTTQVSAFLPRLAIGFLLLSLLTMAVIDFRVYRIPDRINFPSLAIGAGLVVVTSLERGFAGAIFGAAVGALTYATFLFGAHLVYPSGMGWGDVKLAWLMGLFLGWFGWKSGPVLDQALYSIRYVLYGAVVGSLAGVLTSVPYAIVKRSMRAQFPYGPSLAIGCAVIVLYGKDLIG